MELAKSYSGSCRLVFHLSQGEKQKSIRILAHNVKVSTSKEFISLLRSQYGKENIWLE